jgi:hypothetical protein
MPIIKEDKRKRIYKGFLTPEEVTQLLERIKNKQKLNFPCDDGASDGNDFFLKLPNVKISLTLLVFWGKNLK